LKGSFSYEDLNEDAFEEDSEVETNLEGVNKKILEQSESETESEEETEADTHSFSSKKRTFASLEEFEDLLKDESGKVNNIKQVLHSAFSLSLFIMFSFELIDLK
jgi:hypothetical protein